MLSILIHMHVSLLEELCLFSHSFVDCALSEKLILDKRASVGLVKRVAEILIIDEQEIGLHIALFASESSGKRAWSSDDAPSRFHLLGGLCCFHFGLEVEISDFDSASEFSEHRDLSSVI